MPTFTGSSTDAPLIAEHCLEFGLGARAIAEVLAEAAPDLKPNSPGNDDLYPTGTGDWLKLDTTLVYERPGEQGVMWRSELKQRTSNGLLSGTLVLKLWLDGKRRWQLVRQLKPLPVASQRLPWRLEAFKTKVSADDAQTLLRRLPVLEERCAAAVAQAGDTYSAVADGAVWLELELDPEAALAVVRGSTALFATAG